MDTDTAAPAATATAKCTRCGRKLTSAKSITDGYGRTCKAKIAAAAKTAAVATFKPAQVAKAEELIADGGIVAIRARRVFRVVSTDGASTYLTAPQACNCAAGLKAKHACYHRIAATILAAA
ncbi:DUF6011 domain-containing protein [Umezawaea tangerina]|uniref:SWIM-type domain-containing protein n=1 Tax=Umezawaea tangerina TaxID=84725 RepID=A0A2T0TCC3_9PSEU|nr:DUF6011 domain-containing protein [Umezawaea tangerina]PRY43317.1 hypothetical protein CLV43_10357 [Umezawaea tangerina]